ncbi:MAG: SOS response-associated peptidase [Desulfuromonadales bacterium]|nr:SOS response-associated peptidase [Desulfuromonadales bacterium]
MCGRIVTAISPEYLASLFGLQDVPRIEPRYNVAPSQAVGVIRCDDSEHNRFDLMKWGLVPSWSKDTKIASHTINARSETVAEKPAFRHAIKYNRCIIPTSGFYEWLRTDQHKQPYFIHQANHAPMCFAGIWEHWNDPDGAVLETFSILTTTANELIGELHDRMPVILSPEDYEFWLNRNMHDAQLLERLYQPYPAERMAAYKVPDLINNPRFDSPSCILQV